MSKASAYAVIAKSSSDCCLHGWHVDIATAWKALESLAGKYPDHKFEFVKRTGLASYTVMFRLAVDTAS